jgi:hypothetical protein
MAYIPETIDRTAWAERNRIAADYLGRAAQARGAERRVILCQLVSELFDFQVQPRLALVTSEDQLGAFDGELALVWSWIILPHLPSSLNETQLEALRMTVAARRAYWMEAALRRLHPPEPSEKNDRREAVEAYIREIFALTQKRITKADFWRSAGYTSRSEFERWQRYDPKCTKTANANFSRILREKPHLKADFRNARAAPRASL